MYCTGMKIHSLTCTKPIAVFSSFYLLTGLVVQVEQLDGCVCLAD